MPDTQPPVPTSALPRPAAKGSRVPTLICGLFAWNVLLGLIYLASVRYASHPFFRDTGRFWDLNEEANLPAWYSSIQLWMIAVVLGTIAWREFRPRRVASWSLVLAALAFVFLSADEGAMLHERLAIVVDRLVLQRTASSFSRTGIWMFIFGPLLLVFALLIAKGAWEYLRHRPRVVLLGVVGVVIFLSCAGGLEAYSNFLARDTWPYYCEVFAEEVGEMTGATFMLWAACELAQSLGIKLAPAPSE
jgi:hypothetical protein